jgi:hypothetical protein
VGVAAPARACLFIVTQVHTDGGSCGGTGTPIPISATIQLNTVFAGNTPDGMAPWLTATFASDKGSTTGTLTLTSNLSQSDFLQGQSGPNTTTGWSFFLNQVPTSWSCTGDCANGVSTDSINKVGPVPGPFNLTFGWTSKNRFDGADSAIYTLTFGSALTDNPFGANENGWWSVAHVQGITGGCSGWIVYGDGKGADGGTPCTDTTPPTSVPEPADLGMFGIGVLMIGLFLGLRRRLT